METRLFQTIVLFSATIASSSPLGCSSGSHVSGADASVLGAPGNGPSDAVVADAPLDGGADVDAASPAPDTDASDASDAGARSDAAEDAGPDPCVLVDGGGFEECAWNPAVPVAPPLGCQPTLGDSGSAVACVVVDAGWHSTK